LGALLDAIADHPARVAAAWSVLVLIALTQLVDVPHRALKLEVDPSFAALIPPDAPALETYRAFRDRFGSDDALLVGLRFGDVFAVENLAALRRISKDLEALPYVTAVGALDRSIRVEQSGGFVDVRGALDVIPGDAAGIEALAADLLASPLNARLVSRDRTTALVRVLLDSDGAPSASQLDEIAAVVREAAPNAGVMLSGTAAAKAEISRALLADLVQLLPWAVAAVALVGGIAMRSLRGALLPVMANGAAFLLTLALFTATRHQLNVVTAIMPTVLLVVGFAYSIHVVSQFDELADLAGDQPARIRATLRGVAPAVVLTALTTGAGFLSLATSRIDAIREFGLWSALGVGLATLAALTLVPVGLAWLPAKARGAERRTVETGWPRRLARFATRKRREILLAAAGLAGLGGLGVARLQVDTDFVTYFRKGAPLRRDLDALSRSFGGITPLSIEVRADARGAFLEPEHLAELREFQAWLIAQPGVSGTASLADLLDLLTGRKAGSEPAPLSGAGVAQVLDGAPNELREHFSDKRFRSAALRVHVTSSGSADLLALQRRIELRAASAWPEDFQVTVTGNALVFAHTVEAITRGQVASIASAFLMIYATLAFLFQSFRVGWLAMLPNALPILVYFGALGLVGIPLNATTALVAAMVFGIAVDDSIHFLSRFNTEARARADEVQGVREALRHVLRPVTVTTAALVLGMLVFTQSELRNHVEFGVLAALTLTLAWALDLTFTPALCGRMRFVTLWEILTVDLGAKPHQEIELFAGMSPRQARIAALLGTIREVDADTPIMKRGEPGGSLMVVLDGVVSVSIGQDTNRQPIARLGRGKVLGEMTIFGGTRTADVIAESPVRVLRWTSDCLDRIQARHPKVAAKLLRNLIEPMAGRYAGVVARM